MIACELLGLEGRRLQASWSGVEDDYRTPLLEHVAGGPRQLEQVGSVLALSYRSLDQQEGERCGWGVTARCPTGVRGWITRRAG